MHGQCLLAPPMCSTSLPAAALNRLILKNAEGSDLFGYCAICFWRHHCCSYNEESNQTFDNSGSLPTAAGDDDSAGNAGAAYVFTRSGTTWSQQAYLKAPNAEGSDIFGGSVSVSGDTIVVGARGEDSNQTFVSTVQPLAPPLV